MDSILNNGLNVIRGEIHSILTLMRENTRWSSKLIRSQSSLKITSNDKILTPNQFVKLNMAMTMADIPLAHTFLILNEYLDGVYALSEVDMDAYITPFHDIVVSDQANGPLTCAALASLVKFASYGFFSSQFPRAKEGVAMLADCIVHCIFEATDWESDELILMKLLELSTLTYKCDASRLLFVNSALNIYNTCISLQSHYQAKIMQFEAEVALRHLTMTAFSRAHLFATSYADMNTSNIYGDHVSIESSSSMTQKMKIISLKDLEFCGNTYLIRDPDGIPLLLGNIMSILSKFIDIQTQSVTSVIFALTLVNLAIESGGPSIGSIPVLVEILRSDVCRYLLKASQSDSIEVYSLVLRVAFNLFMCIKDHIKIQLEVFITSVHLRILSSSLSASSSSSSSTQTSIISLAKEELTLESLLEFCREPSLMQDIYTNYDCDIQSTNLFNMIVKTLCRRSIPEGFKLSAPDNIFLSENDAIVSYMDVKLEGLVKRSYTNITVANRLALDGLQFILQSISNRCEAFAHELKKGDKLTITSTASFDRLLAKVESSGKDENTFDSENRKERYHRDDDDDDDGDDDDDDIFYLARASTAEILRSRRLRKEHLRITAEKFNSNPLKPDWLQYAVETGIVLHNDNITSTEISSQCKNSKLEMSSDPKSVAQFLRYTPGLNKTQIGLFIGKGPADLYPFHAAVLREYSETFDFSGEYCAFDRALRLFLGHFRLPGEAQCIDRIMEAFAGRLFTALGPNKPFATGDSAFILAFSTIMLNTDLHNPQIPLQKKMTKEQFVKNNRGINDGKDLPREYLENLYDELKSNQIKIDEESQSLGKFILAEVDYSIPSEWEKFLAMRSHINLSASFTPSITAREEAKYASNSTISYKSELSKRSRLLILPIMHEKDMFFTMANQSFETILNLWTYNEDDSVMNRLMSSTCSFLKICSSLKLSEMLGRVINILSKRSLLLFEYEHSRKQEDIIDSESIDITSTRDIEILKQNMEAILRSEWDSFQSPRSKKFIRSLIVSNSSSSSSSSMSTTLGTDLNDSSSSSNSSTTATTTTTMESTTVVDTKQAMDRKVNIEFKPIDHLSPRSITTTMAVDGNEMTIDHPSLSWIGSSKIRGEILLKILLYFIRSCRYIIPHDSWSSFVEILLFSRRHGVLPRELATIRTHYDHLIPSTSIVVTLPLSYYASKCLEAYLPAPKKSALPKSVNSSVKKQSSMNMESSNSNGSSVHSSTNSVRDPSLNKSSSSFWNLLWLDTSDDMDSTNHNSNSSSNNNSNNNKPSPMTSNSNANVTYHSEHIRNLHDFIGLLSKYSTSHNNPDRNTIPFKSIRQSRDTIDGNIIDLSNSLSLPTTQNNSSDNIVASIFDSNYELLRILLSCSGLDRILFITDTENEGIAVISVFDSLMKALTDILNLTISVQNIGIAVKSQIDAVIVLEWMANIILSNPGLVPTLWHKLHRSVLTMVFESEISKILVRAPYFLERCVFLILHQAGKLLTYSSNTPTSIPSIMKVSDSMESANGSAVNILTTDDMIWSSIRLLQHIPTSDMTELGGPVAVGILSLIRVSPRVSLYTPTNQWDILLDLLTSSSSTTTGRIFVWETLNDIIDQNIVTIHNFRRIRYLVLQYVYGDFRSHKHDPESSFDFDLNLFDKSTDQSSPWLLQALMHMLKLCLGTVMATATNTDSLLTILLPKWPGLVLSDNNSITSGDRGRVIYTVGSEEEYDRSYMSNASSLPYYATHICIRPLNVGSLEEIEMFWLYTCKIMSSLVNGHPNVSTRAVFCLQALIEAGKDSTLPSRIWSKLLMDLIEKLPLTLSRSSNNSSSQTIKSSNSANNVVSSDLSKSVSDDGMCLQCCNLIFDLIVNHVRELQENMSDFTSIWLKFIQNLVTNLVILGDKANDIRTKMMDMIVTSLKLLVSAIHLRHMKPNNKSNSNLVAYDNTNDASQTIGGIDANAPAPEGLFQFVTELLGFSGSPVPSDNSKGSFHADLTKQSTVSTTTTTTTTNLPNHDRVNSTIVSSSVVTSAVTVTVTSSSPSILSENVPELTAKAIDLSNSTKFLTPTKVTASTKEKSSTQDVNTIPSTQKTPKIPNSNQMNLSTPLNQTSQVIDPDQTLLNLTWKTIISNYNDFPNHLRSVYPHLMDELDKLILNSSSESVLPNSTPSNLSNSSIENKLG